MIPYGKQEITEDDIQSVKEVLESDFLTQGPCVEKFESDLSFKVNSNYACASNSATSSLHLACLAVGLSEGDYLWTSPNSFVASSNCGLYCGAKIDFVDINPHTLNIDVDNLEIKLKEAQVKNALPKVIVPVHFGGLSCEMDRIYELKQEYGFYIIEDASHAIGGQFNDKMVGSCEFSDICIFSFHPVKIITTAEGGIATTQNEKLFSSMISLRSHGITRDPMQMMQSNLNQPWYYEQISLGLNYRMTDIHAALGISQLKRLEKFIEKRNSLASRYRKKLEKFNIGLQYVPENIWSSYHLFVIRILEGRSQNIRQKIFLDLRENNINVNVHYIPIHLQPYYKNMGFKYGDFPQAEKYYEEAITLPLYPSLSLNQQDYVVDCLEQSLQKYQ